MSHNWYHTPIKTIWQEEGNRHTYKEIIQLPKIIFNYGKPYFFSVFCHLFLYFQKQGLEDGSRMRNEIIIEILHHECEIHDLKYLGLVEDLDSLMKQVAGKVEISPDFGKTKEQILSAFYEIIDYRAFIGGYKDMSVNRLDVSLRHYLKRLLQEMERQMPDISPDKELKVRKTIAYHLSAMIFNRFYDDFRNSDATFSTPKELKQFFGNMAKELYPLSFTRFITQLENSDDEFWNCVGDLLLKLSKLVTIPNISSSMYRDIADGEIVSESYLVVKQAVDEKKVQFHDALHFRKYTYNVCKNKCYEYMRRSRNQRTDSFEDIFVQLEDDSLVESMTENEDDMLYDVNPDNPYEMAKLLSFILYHREHPLHQTVVKGEEEKVALLMDVAIEGMSYDQVIEQQYRGKNLPVSEHKKLNARLRQDYVRIKKKLIARLDEIVRKNGKMSHNQ